MARIAGVNIPTNKRVIVALTYIHGIGPAAAKAIVDKLGIEHSRRVQDRLRDMQEKMKSSEGQQVVLAEMNARPGPKISEKNLDRFAKRITRVLADIDYFLREPLGWREGTAVVWAGMRGAVTVAAAQTLPDDTPQRSVLVLIAFAAAAISLLVQGGTIGPLLGVITPETDPDALDQQDVWAPDGN